MRTLPASVQWRAGYQLKQVQLGLEPQDWKPMATIGPGVKEIRLREDSGAYRVIYIAKFEEAVYVLHCFEKHSQRTSSRDIDVATSRYRELIRERASRGSL
ncbi:MAG TPA: type II toxin-antitoxin system RelE/ParE family toxin [Devosia sp.]